MPSVCTLHTHTHIRYITVAVYCTLFCTPSVHNNNCMEAPSFCAYMVTQRLRAKYLSGKCVAINQVNILETALSGTCRFRQYSTEHLRKTSRSKALVFCGDKGRMTARLFRRALLSGSIYGRHTPDRSHLCLPVAEAVAHTKIRDAASMAVGTLMARNDPAHQNAHPSPDGLWQNRHCLRSCTGSRNWVSPAQSLR